MLVEGIALVTAITNAVSALFISKGMRGSNALSAAIVSTSVQAGILTAFLIVQFPSLNGMAVALFALSGVFALGVGRLLYFVAVGRIGLAVSSAVIGCNPLISALLAIVLLGEKFVFAVFVGALLVVVEHDQLAVAVVQIGEQHLVGAGQLDGDACARVPEVGHDDVQGDVVGVVQPGVPGSDQLHKVVVIIFG